MSARCLSASLLLVASLSSPSAAHECGVDVPGVLFAGCAGETTARLSLVGEGGVIADPASAAARQVTVTGSYTSGERREPEGLFIVGGEALDPVPQGWDGVALIDERGRLTLHHVERVDVGNERFDLRRKPSRRAFARAAKARGWSAFQSHMLVIDGKVDTRPREGASRFARRMLYTLEDGSVGLYQTPSLTLHEAALAIHEALSPVMAFNLDMGSYDYCRIDGENARDCGSLPASQTGKLSNVLTLSKGTTETAAVVE